MTFIHAYLLNRNIAALTLLLWPTLLAVVALASTRHNDDGCRRARSGCRGDLGHEHATSKIAFVGAAAWRVPSLARMTERVIMG